MHFSGSIKVSRQRSRAGYNDNMLPYIGAFYEGDGTRNDYKYRDKSSSKKPHRDPSLTHQDKKNMQVSHHIYEEYKNNGDMSMKRHGRLLSNNNDVGMIGKSSHRSLRPPSHNVLPPGSHNIYHPGFFDPRHNIPTVFSQGQNGGGGNVSNQHQYGHIRNEARERDATLLHHLGRMSPEEQLNKFLKSVEREQELRQMKDSNENLADEKSPRERRRRRQLLKRMTDTGLQQPRRNANTKEHLSETRNQINVDNEYAVIDKKKVTNLRKYPVNNGQEPVRWMSLNGIDNSLVTKEGSDTKHEANPNKTNDAKHENTNNFHLEEKKGVQSGKNKNELDKRKSIAYRSRYRERIDAPKSFASMSQLDNLLNGKNVSDSENEGFEGHEEPLPFYLNKHKNEPDVSATPSNTKYSAQKPIKNNISVVDSVPISPEPHSKLQFNTRLSMTSPMNSESGINENISMENRSKDGKLTWNERKKLSLSMLKAKFSHKGKSSDILSSGHSSKSHSPISVSHRDNFQVQTNNNISPIDKMSTGSEDATKSGPSALSYSEKVIHRYTTSIPLEDKDRMFIETDDPEDDDDEYDRMDGTEISCSCTDVTLDDKYKIAHKHVPASSNYNERKIGLGRENDDEETITRRNIGRIENANQDDTREMIESEQHIDGSRSLDNITAGFTTTNSVHLDDTQPFFSLNDSTTGTKVNHLMVYTLY